MSFYRDPELQALKYPELKQISDVPQGIWIWGANIKKVISTIAGSYPKGETPVFVIYNGPNDKDTKYGSGITNYLDFTTQVKNAIGNATAWVILEPDSLPLWSGQANTATALAQLKQAVITLKQAPNVKVYIDAGHSNWISSDVMAQMLWKSGIDHADGFSLNVSNFRTTTESLKYGKELSAKVNGKHFVIDTSRNGNGPSLDNQWCNPPGRALGLLPSTVTGEPLCDAFLWVKCPGESDGTCNGGPPAGQLWLQYGIDLIKNTNVPPVPPGQWKATVTYSDYNTIKIELTR